MVSAYIHSFDRDCKVVSVLFTVLLLWRDTMTKVTYEKKHLVRDLLTVSELVLYHRGREHGGRLAWCWSSSSELLHPDPQAAGREKETLGGPGEDFGNLKAHSQWYTSFNIAMSPNPSQTVHQPNIQTYEPMGAILIQTIRVSKLNLIILRACLLWYLSQARHQKVSVSTSDNE